MVFLDLAILEEISSWLWMYNRSLICKEAYKIKTDGLKDPLANCWFVIRKLFPWVCWPSHLGIKTPCTEKGIRYYVVPINTCFIFLAFLCLYACEIELCHKFWHSTVSSQLKKGWDYIHLGCVCLLCISAPLVGPMSLKYLSIWKPEYSAGICM